MSETILRVYSFYYRQMVQGLKVIPTELGTFEWWISGLMLDPLFFLLSRLNNACYSLVINLQRWELLNGISLILIG